MIEHTTTARRLPLVCLLFMIAALYATMFATDHHSPLDQPQSPTPSPPPTTSGRSLQSLSDTPLNDGHRPQARDLDNSPALPPNSKEARSDTTSAPSIFGVPISVDPASSFLSVVAIYIAIFVYCATTTHRVRLVDLHSTFHHGLDGTFRRLEATIRNVGLPIRSMTVYLEFMCFQPDGKWRSTRVGLGSRQAETFENGSLAKVALNLRLPLYRADSEHIAKCLSCFAQQSPRQTLPQLVICSGDFDIVTIKLVKRTDAIAERWNSFATRVNRYFDRHGTFPDGQTWVESGKILPQIDCESWSKLQVLGEACQRDLLDRIPKTPRNPAAADD